MMVRKFNGMALASLQAASLTATQPVPSDVIMVQRSLGEYFQNPDGMQIMKQWK